MATDKSIGTDCMFSLITEGHVARLNLLFDRSN